MGLLDTAGEGRPILRPVDPTIETVGGGGTPDLESLLGEGQDVKTWHSQREQIELRNDLVYPRHPSGLLQLVVPRTLKTEFLQLAHSGISGGHLGVRRTRFQVRRRAYCTGWSDDMKRFVGCCERCQRYIRRPLPHKAGMINIKLGEPNEFWSDDLTGPHVTSRHGYCYIFTAMDCFTRYSPRGRPARRVNKPARFE